MANQFSTEEGRIADDLRRDEKRKANYRKIGWSKDFLELEFIENNRSLESIAGEFRVGIKFLRGALSYYGIVKPMNLRAPKGKKNPKGSEALKEIHAKRSTQSKLEIEYKSRETKKAIRLAKLSDQGINEESLTELYII